MCDRSRWNIQWYGIWSGSSYLTRDVLNDGSWRLVSKGHLHWPRSLCSCLKSWQDFSRSFLQDKHAPCFNALLPARVRSNGETFCRRSLDISSIKFRFRIPFNVRSFQGPIPFNQMIPEAEVSNAEWKTKNQLRPWKQPVPSLNLALLCQAVFKRGAKLVCSVNCCMLKSKMNNTFHAKHENSNSSWHSVSCFSSFGALCSSSLRHLVFRHCSNRTSNRLAMCRYVSSQDCQHAAGSGAVAFKHQRHQGEQHRRSSHFAKSEWSVGMVWATWSTKYNYCWQFKAKL